MRVLVTNGETRPALAIARSLGRRGDEVIVAAERHPSLASVSRYCRGREICPPPDRQPEAFVDAVVEMAVRRRAELVLPVTEITTTLLAEHRQRLPPGCALPLPGTASLRVANDKSQVLELARSLGVPTPVTCVLQHPSDLASAHVPPFPVVVKPARSRVPTRSGWLSGGVEYAADTFELSDRLRRIQPELYPVLLQERIAGPGVGIFACFDRGRPLAMFSHTRLREKPPSGGVSVLCESTPVDPLGADHVRRLLEALRWHGVAMVEFKRDDRDGTLRLMEVNGRFWGSLQLAVDAGVDFPALVAAVASGVPVAVAGAYRVGIRSRWFLGDLDALLSVMFHRADGLRLPRGHPGRLRMFVQFLTTGGARQRNELFRFDDPAPGLLELWRWLSPG